jgi:hypothetical protein
MSDFVLLRLVVPRDRWVRLPTDRIADVVPIKNAGWALVPMKGGFEAPTYVATLESARAAGLVPV